MPQVDQLCCTFHPVTLVYFFVGVDHSIIVFTSDFTSFVVETWYVGDLLSGWSDYLNVIILNVGVLLIKL